MQKILVTGGAGYIGSHTCIELLEAGYEVVVVDNLSNSNTEALKRVESITGKSITFYLVDIRERDKMAAVFAEHAFSAVIHFAGLKSVGESVAQPLKYYDNNIYGTQVLLETMQRHDLYNLVFSSSATVYGEPASVPITESFPLSAVILTTVPLTSASISFISFMASIIPIVWPWVTRSPSFTNAGSPGAGDR